MSSGATAGKEVAKLNGSVWAYLGPEGTWSHEAVLLAMGKFGRASHGEGSLLECATIAEVFEMVERGRADYGVVPIENALEGSVNETLDAFVFHSGAQILHELVLDIHHDLIAAPGSELSQIDTILSHPQALAQCRHWLAFNKPTAKTQAATSTAQAVKDVLEAASGGRANLAAIGSRLASGLFGASVLATEIEDHFGNQTRFVVLGNKGSRRTGSDKTSLALFMKQDRPGTLLMILAEFAYAGLNLTKIQSRPTKRALGDYMFWIDVDGHVDDLDVKTALDSLRLKLREVKALGSYPRADAPGAEEDAASGDGDAARG
jgi:prephenate dehydratase